MLFAEYVDDPRLAASENRPWPESRTRNQVKCNNMASTTYVGLGQMPSHLVATGEHFMGLYARQIIPIAATDRYPTSVRTRAS